MIELERQNTVLKRKLEKAKHGGNEETKPKVTPTSTSRLRLRLHSHLSSTSGSTTTSVSNSTTERHAFANRTHPPAYLHFRLPPGYGRVHARAVKDRRDRPATLAEHPARGVGGEPA